MNPSFADRMLTVLAWIGYVVWHDPLATLADLGVVVLALFLVAAVCRVVKAANSWIENRLDAHHARQAGADRMWDEVHRALDGPVSFDDSSDEIPGAFNITRIPPRPAARHDLPRRHAPRSRLHRRVLDRARRTTRIKP